MVEAKYWSSLAEGKVLCELCPHHCSLAEGQAGICMGRLNKNGKLFTKNYGEVVSAAVDPIEKKPLYHFYPGSVIFSVGPNGCNLSCPFCQNWEIAQTEVSTSHISPAELVRAAGQNDSIGLSYTYAEPLIWYEYLLDCAELAKNAGLVNVLVTNGFVEEKPLRELLPFVDAFNIDLKSIRAPFYRKLCKAALEPVLRTCRIAKEYCHVEITNLIIPGENDTDEEIAELVRWVATNLGRETPLHFSRYFPHHKMTAPPTPETTLRRAYDKGMESLYYCYLGNVYAKNGSDTCCPKCGNTLVQRSGYSVRITGIEGRKCSRCGREADFVLD
jgi:pyruvate formate lyase activating enzyme